MTPKTDNQAVYIRPYFGTEIKTPERHQDASKLNLISISALLQRRKIGVNSPSDKLTVSLTPEFRSKTHSFRQQLLQKSPQHSRQLLTQHYKIEVHNKPEALVHQIESYVDLKTLLKIKLRLELQANLQPDNSLGNSQERLANTRLNQLPQDYPVTFADFVSWPQEQYRHYHMTQRDEIKYRDITNGYKTRDTQH